MLKFGYLGMLFFTICGSFWLEIILKVRVLSRFRRAFLSIATVALGFLVWDAYAISAKNWKFDTRQIIGVYIPFKIPIEEVLFFIIIPLAAIMTLEAVRSVKSTWLFGDEK